MKRLLVLALVLALFAVMSAGCGGETPTDTTADTNAQEDTSRVGPVETADAAACAANRAIISTVAQEYYFMEGVYPSSIRALVPSYLQSVPECPSGGTYTLRENTVTCSVHGS